MAVDTEVRLDQSAVYLDRRLARGSAVLMTGGLLVWVLGATVGAVAVVSACRRYVAAMEEPPRAVARRRLRQVRSATMAGVGAWRESDRH